MVNKNKIEHFVQTETVYTFEDINGKNLTLFMIRDYVITLLNQIQHEGDLKIKPYVRFSKNG